jgi:RimK-like ATP-grasp domain
MLALYYDRVRAARIVDGKELPTSRYDLMDRLEDRLGGGNVRYVTSDCYDTNSDVFIGGYTHDGPSSPPLKFTDSEFRADLIVDRGFFTTRHPKSSIPTVSGIDLRKISIDKFLMYNTLAAYMPKSIPHIAGGDIDKSALSRLGTKVIVKSRTGSGGKKIWVVNTQELQNKVTNGTLTGDLLIQQCIESNGELAGMRGVGRHDLRLFIAGDKICGAHIRVPSVNNYVSNTNRGGTLRMLNLNEIPEDLVVFAQLVLANLPNVRRILSIDCFYDADTRSWKLIEINANAGLPSASLGEDAAKCLDAVADYAAKEYNKLMEIL